MKKCKWLAVVLALCMVFAMSVSAFAAVDPTEEGMKEAFERNAMLCTYFGDGNGYFTETENVPDHAAYEYAKGLLWDEQYDQYLDEAGDYWTLPYSEYIALIDGTYVNHSDMKAFIESYTNSKYDPETDMVTIESFGGVGGPTAWVPLTVYQSGSAYYVRGLFLDEIVEDTTGLTENVDYYKYYNGYSDPLMYIISPIEAKFVETDEGLKIAAYYKTDSYVIDDVMYKVGAGKSYPVGVCYYEYNSFTDTTEEVASNGVTVSGLTDSLTSWNGRLWRGENDKVSFTASVADGWKIKEITYSDKSGNSGKAEAASGTYTISADDALIINVIAERVVPADAEYSMYEGCLDYGTFEGEGFVVEGDVLTYDNAEYGKYYRLNFDIENGIYLDGTVSGGNAHSMTTKLLDKNGDVSYWSRDHKCENNCRTDLFFATNEDCAIKYELVPASAGTIERALGNYNIVKINLTAPATLKVTKETKPSETVIENETGASATTDGDNLYYGALDLVVDELDESSDSGAAELVISKLGEGSKAIAYDIHLEYNGQEMPVLDGDTVTVTIPVPAGWVAGDVLVYHAAEDGTLTDMKAVPSADGKTVTFTTTHFSTYVIAQKEHVHSFGDWTIDAVNHWKECACGEKIESAAHDFKWVIDKEATATTDGSKHEVCTVCGYTMPHVKIPATGAGNPDPNVPATGDNSHQLLWTVLMLASFSGLAGLTIYRKRRTSK